MLKFIVLLAIMVVLVAARKKKTHPPSLYCNNPRTTQVECEALPNCFWQASSGHCRFNG